MLDCQVAMLEDALARYSVTRKIPGPLGTRHPSITPFQQFRATDGFFVAGAGNEAIWQRIVRCDRDAGTQGRPPLSSAIPIAPRIIRELEAILARLFATRPRDHWLKLLDDAAVPCAPIANVEEVTRNPHLEDAR